MELEGKTPGGSNEEELAAATSANESFLTENSSTKNNLDEQPTSFTLKFITYNIYGLAREEFVQTKARTRAVCSIIKKEQADIVFLQEVTPLTAVIIKRKLSNYHCYFAHKDEQYSENEQDKEDEENGTDEEDEGPEEDKQNETSRYFVGTLIKKSSVSFIHTEVIKFPNSRMSRNLLKVNVKYKDLPICLLNSHLESLENFSEERKNQLKIAFENMLQAPEGETVIFGGDTNLMEKELIELGGLPLGIEDVWVSCGSQKQYAYTFDLYKNDSLKVKCKAAHRYDRIYVRRSSVPKLKPVSFKLIGLERLSPPFGCFPSDHWGILCHFDRDGFKFKLKEGFSKDSDEVQVLQPLWMEKPQFKSHRLLCVKQRRET